MSSERPFKVWCLTKGEEYTSDAKTIMGLDAFTAAEEWANHEDWNSTNFWIVGGTPAEVMVMSRDGTINKYIVTGESVRQYRAKLVI